MNANANKQDIYQRITSEIVKAIEEGAGEWRMPWHFDGSQIGFPQNIVSGKPYRGVNVLALWTMAMRRGYLSSEWATLRQWNTLGARVRKGEKSTSIVLWKPKEAKDDAIDASEDERPQRGLIARGFAVFNAQQVDGYEIPKQQATAEEVRIGACEEFTAGLGADIRENAPGAFYSPAEDFVGMPSIGYFRDVESYYSILFHELTHWTGAKHRLDRNLSTRFRSSAYAAEELIAELGAAFLCAKLGVSSEPRRDHAGYISSWLTLLRSDPRAIFTAAAKAQLAVDWMIAAADVTRSVNETKHAAVAGA